MIMAADYKNTIKQLDDTAPVFLKHAQRLRTPFREIRMRSTILQSRMWNTSAMTGRCSITPETAI